MMNHYETVFIITPVLSDAQVKEAVTQFSKVLTDNGAEIIVKENWGLKKLAYPIDTKLQVFITLLKYRTCNLRLATCNLQPVT